MDQPKFKPGQQWLSRDGKSTFHIMTTDENYVYAVGISGDCKGQTVWFFTNGTYWITKLSEYDLVTLIKDVE